MLYEFYEDYLIERRGVFSVTRRELYYHRIKGIRQEAPFLYRLVGISTVQVTSSDPFASFFQFTAVPNGLEFSNVLRQRLQSGRKKVRLQELDVYQL